MAMANEQQWHVSQLNNSNTLTKRFGVNGLPMFQFFSILRGQLSGRVVFSSKDMRRKVDSDGDDGQDDTQFGHGKGCLFGS